MFLIAAAALLACTAPAAMAQSRDGYRGAEQHGAQRGYGNSDGYGFNGGYAYNDGNHRQTYRNDDRRPYRDHDRGYRDDRRHDLRREHRRDDRY